MTGGLATKWEALCLVPERSVEGLVTRRWDKANVRKPNMNIKKCKMLNMNLSCPVLLNLTTPSSGVGRHDRS